MNDVFTCIRIHTVWHLMALLQFIRFIIFMQPKQRCRKVGLSKWGDLGTWHFSRPLELYRLEKKISKLHKEVTCFSRRLVLSVVPPLQMASHSLQCRLMVSWPKRGGMPTLAAAAHSGQTPERTRGSKGNNDVTWSCTINGHRVSAC